MIKLYGMSGSNYYDLVKSVLMERAIDFEEVMAMPSQDKDFLAISPMGKVPCLQTDDAVRQVVEASG